MAGLGFAGMEAAAFARPAMVAALRAAAPIGVPALRFGVIGGFIMPGMLVFSYQEGG
jgi:hypothetical protein